MNARSSARQYASALFDVASRLGKIDPIQRDLADFTALVASHDELRRAFEERGIEPARKRAVLHALFDRSGAPVVELQRLLLWLADRGRLSLLSEIEHAYGTRVLDASHVVTAEVTTAVPLGESAKTSLRQALSAATGRDVVMTERVDERIVGGIVAKVGSVVFDGSVTRQLERLRDRLLAEV